MTGAAYDTEHQETVVLGENSRIAHQIVNTFVTGDTSALEDVVAVDAIDHNTAPHGTGDRAGLIADISFYRATFSDLQVTVEQELETGDLVAIYGQITGVHSGGALGIPATGKRVSFPYIDIFRIADGQMVEAASADAEAARLWAVTRQQRLAGQSQIASGLAGKQALRPVWAQAEAADVIYTLMAPEVYYLLTVDRGWSPGAYESWLANTLKATLLK